MKRSHRILTLMISSVLLLAINPVVAAGKPLPVLRGTKIAFGQTKEFPEAGITVTFEDVVEDSRCPTGAMCIWEGAVVVSFFVEHESYGQG